MTKYPTFPSILASCWPALKDDGWHVHSTRPTDEVVANHAIFAELCAAHGERNVAIGHCWDEERMAPAPDPEHLSFYIRDVEDQVRDFQRSLQAL